MKYIIYIFSAVWELPQNILGLVFLLVQVLSGNIEHINFEKHRVFIKIKHAAVSLGIFVFWSSEDNRYVKIKDSNKLHEYGHTIQSRIFGPLYLFVIGIPSILRVIYGIIYFKKKGRRWNRYYDGYPENWADKLGKAK